MENISYLAFIENSKHNTMDTHKLQLIGTPPLTLYIVCIAHEESIYEERKVPDNGENGQDKYGKQKVKQKENVYI